MLSKSDWFIWRWASWAAGPGVYTTPELRVTSHNRAEETEIRSKWLIVGLVAAAAGLAVALGLILTGKGQESSLRALPPGPPTVMTADAALETHPLSELMQTEPFVFVGTVREVGGSESVGRLQSGFDLTRHRIRMDVDSQLRGTLPDTVDISVLDLPETTRDFKPGEQYVVFADYLTLGSNRVNALVPDGYAAGAYLLKNGIAVNKYGESAGLTEITAQVKAANN